MNQHLDILVWCTYAVVTGIIVYAGYRALKGHTSAPKSFSNFQKPLRVETQDSGLESQIFQEGSGPAAKKFDKMTVHYVVSLSTGKQIDSSYQRGKPLSFKLGKGEVIQGWEEALIGAKRGEKRKVTVPSSLAYGNAGKGKVPANSILIFEIEIIDVG